MLIGATNSSTEFKGGFFDGYFQLGAPTNFPINEWKQLTVTWDGTDIKTYVNGTFVNYTTIGSPSYASHNSYYRIGGRWDSENYVTGEIGSLIIYPKALSAGEVTAYYNSTVSTYT